MATLTVRRAVTELRLLVQVWRGTSRRGFISISKPSAKFSNLAGSSQSHWCCSLLAIVCAFVSRIRGLTVGKCGTLGQVSVRIT